jgi:DNA-binding response OmpR family regulator
MHVLLLTADSDPETVLPSLSLLALTVRPAQADVSSVIDVAADMTLVDARADLTAARDLCQLLALTAPHVPVIAVVNESDLVAINTAWRVDEILRPETGPAELDARLRLLADRQHGAARENGDLVLDEQAQAALLRGRPIRLTNKEFELLNYLMRHPGRVFTREHLLRAVWGYSLYGGSRTIDVHVRRLREKLGPEYQSLIGTVRGVGYKSGAGAAVGCS